MSEERPPTVRCKTCRKKARRVFAHSVLPVIHEYFDCGMGRVVKGRSHLREVQRELGCVDADVKAMKPSTGWDS